MCLPWLRPCKALSIMKYNWGYGILESITMHIVISPHVHPAAATPNHHEFGYEVLLYDIMCWKCPTMCTKCIALQHSTNIRVVNKIVYNLVQLVWVVFISIPAFTVFLSADHTISYSSKISWGSSNQFCKSLSTRAHLCVQGAYQACFDVACRIWGKGL